MTDTSDVRAELAETLRHRIRPMTGRDPDERNRVSTPLELLYDLTYVVAFGVAAEQLALGIEHGAIGASIGAYLFAIFAVTGAWTSFTWLSSAYGNDDVLFRVATIVQMIGAVILVFGLPGSFEAAADGKVPVNALVVVGYSVMRLPQLALWVRAAVKDPAHRRTAVGYAVAIAVVQPLWALIALLPLDATVAVVLLCALVVVELGAPVLIEWRMGRLPWNPEHIAERFSLLTLITLGEVVAATAAAVSALVQEHGWSLPAVVVVSAGILVAASLWWAYFLIPSRVILPLFPHRTLLWRYVHLPMFGAIAAVGAGLRVTAAAVGEPGMSLMVVVLSLALPVMVVILLVFVTWSVLMRAYDLSHVPLFLLAIAPIVAAVVLALIAGHSTFDPDDGGDLTLLVVAVGLVSLGCIVEVVGHEMVGFEHTRRVVEKPDRDAQRA